MAKELDKILVVDVESTCWNNKPPPGQESEIIEIGLCTLDVATCERQDRKCILVRPERSSVSAFCTQLTTLTQEQVDGGVSFEEACRMLKDTFVSKRRLWASYGDYDRRQFESHCALRDTEYPFGPTHLNIKNLFAVAFGLRRELGMSGALARLDLPLEGVHHRGEDDAWNIAGILSVLISRLRLNDGRKATLE